MSHRIFNPSNIMNGIILGGSSHHHHHHPHLVKRDNGGSLLLSPNLGLTNEDYSKKISGLSTKLKSLHLKKTGEGIKIKRKNISLQI